VEDEELLSGVPGDQRGRDPRDRRPAGGWPQEPGRAGQSHGGAHAPSLYRLLRALASVGVFAERDDGSFVSTRFFEAVTEGADAYLLKSVIHDWDDAAATQILRNKCRAAMRDTGRVLLVERVVRPVNEPDPAKFSDPNMLVELGGRERTAEEFGRLYAEAGFRLTDIVPTGSPYHIIEGAPV
jgi:hypothetical protein